MCQFVRGLNGIEPSNPDTGRLAPHRFDSNTGRLAPHRFHLSLRDALRSLSELCRLSILCIVCIAMSIGMSIGLPIRLQAFEASRPPNIVFILADDLGYGDCGCYGQTRLKTPSIDRLASQGLRWTQFYAGSTVCAPSRCVLMTGKHTGRCLIRGNSKDNLPTDEKVFPEVLARGGYKCGLFGKWGLGQAGSSGAPLRKGFSDFFGYLDQTHAHNFFPTFLDDMDLSLIHI